MRGSQSCEGKVKREIPPSFPLWPPREEHWTGSEACVCVVVCESGGDVGIKRGSGAMQRQYINLHDQQASAPERPFLLVNSWQVTHTTGCVELINRPWIPSAFVHEYIDRYCLYYSIRLNMWTLTLIISLTAGSATKLSNAIENGSVNLLTPWGRFWCPSRKPIQRSQCRQVDSNAGICFFSGGKTIALITCWGRGVFMCSGYL